LKALKAEGLTLQEVQGAHFRSVTEWTPDEEARRAGFEQDRERIEHEKRDLRTQIQRFKAERQQIERGPEALAARETIRTIENEAELARLYLIRNALLTSEGLPHTNHRPSAWWLPVVDSTGEWFRRIADTTELYTEPLM
jgi:hypothetical protein